MNKYPEWRLGTTLASVATSMHVSYLGRTTQTVGIARHTIPCDELIRLAEVHLKNIGAHDPSVSTFVVKDVKDAAMLNAIEFAVQRENLKRGKPFLTWENDTGYPNPTIPYQSTIAAYDKYFKNDIAPTLDVRFTSAFSPDAATVGLERAKLALKTQAELLKTRVEEPDAKKLELNKKLEKDVWMPPPKKPGKNY